MDRKAMQRRFSLRIKAFRRNEKGGTAVEFALISIPFFALLFAIIETGIAFLNGQFLDRAVEKASRQIFTGQLAQMPGAPAAKLNKFKTDVCGFLNAFMDCSKLYYDVNAYNTFGDTMLSIPTGPGGLNTSGLPRFNPGTSGQIVVARVYYLQPIFADILGTGLANSGTNQRLLVGTAVFRNEPF